MRVAYVNDVWPRAAHITARTSLKLLDYTMCGLRASTPGPILADTENLWPPDGDLQAPWCPMCYQLASDALPHHACLRYNGPAGLVTHVADALQEHGVTVSWTVPTEEPDSVVEIMLLVTGPRIAMRTAVAEIRNGLDTRGTLHFDNQRRRTKAG